MAMQISRTNALQGVRVHHSIGRIKASSCWHATNASTAEADRRAAVEALIREAEDYDADAIIGLDFEVEALKSPWTSTASPCSASRSPASPSNSPKPPDRQCGQRRASFGRSIVALLYCRDDSPIRTRVPAVCCKANRRTSRRRFRARAHRPRAGACKCNCRRG
jgi:hypothetical protein